METVKKDIENSLAKLLDFDADLDKDLNPSHLSKLNIRLKSVTYHSSEESSVAGIDVITALSHSQDKPALLIRIKRYINFTDDKKGLVTTYQTEYNPLLSDTAIIVILKLLERTIKDYESNLSANKSTNKLNEERAVQAVNSAAVRLR